MRNILKAIVFTGIMGVATATWGTRQEIKIGDNVNVVIPEEIKEMVFLNEDIPCITATSLLFIEPITGTLSLDISLVDISSVFRNGVYHFMALCGKNQSYLRPGKTVHVEEEEYLDIYSDLSATQNSFSGFEDITSVSKYLKSLGLTDQQQVDFSAVYRIKIKATNTDNTEVSKCFDLLCGGKCDLSTQKAPLEVIPEETIPDILTKNSAGQIVFAPPRPIGTVRLPKGHTCSDIGVQTITETGANPLPYRIFLRQKGQDGYCVSNLGIGALTDSDIIELAVAPNLKEELVTDFGASGAFDWSSVVRVCIVTVQ